MENSEFNLYDELEMRKAYLVCNALNHPLRKKILGTIQSEEKINVTTLCSRLNLVQAVASQQLAILRRVKVVKAERQGRQIFYSLHSKQLDHIRSKVSELLESKI